MNISILVLSCRLNEMFITIDFHLFWFFMINSEGKWISRHLRSKWIPVRFHSFDWLWYSVKINILPLWMKINTNSLSFILLTIWWRLSENEFSVISMTITERFRHFQWMPVNEKASLIFHRMLNTWGEVRNEVRWRKMKWRKELITNGNLLPHGVLNE